MKNDQFGTADNLAPQRKEDNLAPEQFCTVVENKQFGNIIKSDKRGTNIYSTNIIQVVCVENVDCTFSEIYFQIGYIMPTIFNLV